MRLILCATLTATVIYVISIQIPLVALCFSVGAILGFLLGLILCEVQRDRPTRPATLRCPHCGHKVRRPLPTVKRLPSFTTGMPQYAQAY